MNERLASILILLLAASFVGPGGNAAQEIDTDKDAVVASGDLAPAGPPTAPPTRIDAGESCVVDLEQPYAISGTLTGTVIVDYRIFVAGSCGAAPGSFAEEWIAHGKFTGTLDGAPASGHLSYLAKVEVGGDVEGSIVLGQGMKGQLVVRGNFGDRKLSYQGEVR